MLGPEIQFTDHEYIIFEGKKLLYLAGTDYHRLTSNPIILKAASEAIMKNGINPTGSRVTTGNHSILLQLEGALADFFSSESAAVLPSGYLSNAVLLEAIGQDFNMIFSDEKAHNSLTDAASQVCNKNKIEMYRYKHADAQDLEAQLKKNISGKSRPLVMSDGVFPADGDMPPLEEYVEVIRNFNGRILLDDAHAMAVVGKSGKGSWEEMGIDRKYIYQTGTLGKGFGAYGGIIPGEGDLIKNIYEKSNAFIGSTGLALPLAGAAIASINYLNSNHERITELQSKSKFLKGKFRNMGFEMPETPAPIFSFAFDDVGKSKRLTKALMDNGIYPPFINYPGAPIGGHFRFIITSTTTTEQINLLLDTLESLN